MSDKTAKLDTSLRQIYGHELNLVFERFKEDPPKSILYRGAPVTNLVAALSSQHLAADSYVFDSKITIIDEDNGQVRFGISFLGTTPPVPNDHFLYITVMAKVFHVDSDYGVDIDGISNVVEMPFGSSVDDIMASVGPTQNKSKIYLRGALGRSRYGELSAVYSERSRIFTGIDLVHKMVTIAEDNFADIEAVTTRTHASAPNSDVKYNLEEAIWYANLHRYNPLEPQFIGKPDHVTSYYEEIVEDLETLLIIEPDAERAQWLERWYLSLQAMNYQATDMLRARLAYTENLLSRAKILNNDAFARHEPAVRAALERSKGSIVSSLQREILSKAKNDLDQGATTVPSPDELKPKEIRKSSAGRQLSRFDLEVMLKKGDRVFMVIERPEEDPIRIGATIDLHDTTVLDFTADDGENYSTFWCDWRNKENRFVTVMTAEEDAQIVTTLYEIVEEG